jgi:hypothetical protein
MYILVGDRHNDPLYGRMLYNLFQMGFFKALDNSFNMTMEYPAHMTFNEGAAFSMQQKAQLDLRLMEGAALGRGANAYGKALHEKTMVHAQRIACAAHCMCEGSE